MADSTSNNTIHKENQKAIAIERIKNINKGYKGDGKLGLRKTLKPMVLQITTNKDKVLGRKERGYK